MVKCKATEIYKLSNKREGRSQNHNITSRVAFQRTLSKETCCACVPHHLAATYFGQGDRT